MGVAAAGRLWCQTCGAYVVPGTHGIHESCYGHGPSVELPADEVTGARAVAVVIAAAIALAFVLFVTVALFALGTKL